MATELPSVATVNDEQAAALLWCYGSIEGYQAAMIQHMIADLRQKRQAEIQATFQTRLDELKADEHTAMQELDALLDDLINPTPEPILDNPG